VPLHEAGSVCSSWYVKTPHLNPPRGRGGIGIIDEAPDEVRELEPMNLEPHDGEVRVEVRDED